MPGPATRNSSFCVGPEGGWTYSVSQDGLGTGEATASNSPNGRPSHTGGWNYLFADSHVKWFRPEQTVHLPGATWDTGDWTMRDDD